MINNKIRYEIDASGNYLQQRIGSVRALADYTTTLEVVSPLPIDTSVMVNFIVYDSRNINLPLFLIPISRKGFEVSSNPIVADWHVWEVPLSATILAAISKYRAGRIGVSFSFRERITSDLAVNYLGKFTQASELPSVANEGDFYIANGYNILANSTLYNYGDNAIWINGAWKRDKNFRVTLTTPTTNIPVDPALLASVPDDVEEQDIIDIVSQWGASFAELNDTYETHIGLQLQLEERQDIVEQSLDELINNEVLQGVIATDIENKLNAKEQEYAPRLFNVEQSKAGIDYVDTKVNAVASGSPKGTYANLVALQAAMPSGDNNIYITLDNGHWNYWDGSEWVSGGIYQATMSLLEISIDGISNEIPADTDNFLIKGRMEQGIQGEYLEMATWETPSASNEIIINEAGKFLKKKVGRLVLNGSENWSRSSYGYYRVNIDTGLAYKVGVRNDISSNIYTSSTGNNIMNNGGDKIFSVNNLEIADNVEQITVRDNQYLDLVSYKNHLSSSNLMIYYNVPEEIIPLNLVNVYVVNPKITINDEENSFLESRTFTETLKADEDTYDYIDKNFMLHQLVGVPEEVIRPANVDYNTPIFLQKGYTLELSSESGVLPIFIALYQPTETVVLLKELYDKATKEEVFNINQRTSALEENVEELTDIVDTLTEFGIGEPIELPQYALDLFDTTVDKIKDDFKMHTLNFTTISDIHGNGSLQEKTKRELDLITLLDRKFQFDFHVNLGDWFYNSADNEKIITYIKWKNDLMLRTKAKWLLTLGNHDDNYYVEGGVTIPNLTAEFWSKIYRPHSKHYQNYDPTVEFPLHYFIDYPKQKIRVIMMNAYDSNSDSDFAYWGYRKKQVEWLVDVALDFSDKKDKSKWAVVMMSHMGDRVDISYYYTLVTIRNGIAINNILKAFNSGTAFNTTMLNDVDETFNISGDFTNQGEMEVIMWVYGHSHYDILHKPDDCNWWYFNTACSYPVVRDVNPNMIVPYEIPQPRTLGTVNEFLFNVISIDRFNRKVKITRVGAGNDKEFTY